MAMTDRNGALPQIALSIVCTSLVLAGCGLKGDLYIEEPDAGTEEQVVTDNAATGAETSADKKNPDWVERLELEKEKRSDSSATSAAPAITTPDATDEPPVLTEQDALQNAQQESEKELGVPALEYSTPADDDTDGSTTEDGNSTP
jgi:predicted small lipoprotein YifL